MSKQNSIYLPMHYCKTFYDATILNVARPAAPSPETGLLNMSRRLLLVAYLKRRTILRPRLAMIIDPRRGNVGMP